MFPDLRFLLAPSRLRAALLATVLALSGGPAAAAPSLCLDRPIRYAHYEFGLLYAAEQGGIDEDIRQELEKRSGCAFEVSLRPRARIWLELERGDIDMAGSGVQTPQRDRFVWFAHYVYEDNQVLLAPGVPTGVHGMESFIAQPGLRLGSVRSFSYSPFYDRQVERLQRDKRVVAVSDTRSLFRQMALGQFDALIASPFLTRYYTQKLGMQPGRIEDWDPGPATPSGLVIAKRSFTPAQARGWQALVQQLLADGTVQRIVAQRLGDAEAAERAVYRSR